MLVDPHRARVGYRKIPAQDDGRRLEENAPALGQLRGAQVSTERVAQSALISTCLSMTAPSFLERCERGPNKRMKPRLRSQESSHVQLRVGSAGRPMTALGVWRSTPYGGTAVPCA